MNEEDELLEGLIKTQADKDLEGLLPRLDHRMHGLLTPKHMFRKRTLKRALALSVIAGLFFSLGLYVGQNSSFHLALTVKEASERIPVSIALTKDYEQPQVVATGSGDPLAMALQAAGRVYSAPYLLTIIDADENIDSARAEETKSVEDSEQLVLIETGLNTGVFRGQAGGNLAALVIWNNNIIRQPAALVMNTAGEIFVADRVSESQTIVYKIAPKRLWEYRLSNRRQTPKPE